MAKILNFFGSPGASKSTNSALLFSLLKRHDVKCELVVEYAKEVVYRGDIHTLSECQPLIFGKQHHRIVRAAKHVDYVVCDSPIALSAIYGKDMPESFKRSCIDIFNNFTNQNYYIKLDPSRYKRYGRTQTLEESLEIEKSILSTLDNYRIPYTMVRNAEEVFQLLQPELKFYNKSCGFIGNNGIRCNGKVTMEAFGILCCREHGLQRLEYFGAGE